MGLCLSCALPTCHYHRGKVLFVKVKVKVRVRVGIRAVYPSGISMVRYVLGAYPSGDGYVTFLGKCPLSWGYTYF